MKKTKLSLLAVLLLTACSTPAANELKLKKNTYTYELGSEISLDPKDYLENTDTVILSQTTLDVYLVTDGNTAEIPLDNTNHLPVGEYVFKLIYHDETEEINVTIQDTTAPEFIKFSNVVTFQIGDKVILNQIFNAADQSKVIITVEGFVNFNQIGEYPVKFIATDEYGNKTVKDCLIKIAEKADIPLPKPVTYPI